MKLFAAVSLAAAVAAAPTTPAKRTTDAPYGIKKGLAYNNGALTNTLSTSGSATWAYNWGVTSDAPKFQQIPMIWGPGAGIAGALAMYNARPGDTPWILGYNEPDMNSAGGGCDQTPQQAYNSWGNDMFQFANKGIKLVCPAVTSDNSATGATGGVSGLQWLKAFTSIGNNPSQFKCSAQALHWYGTNGQSGAAQAQSFISYIESAAPQINSMFGVSSMPLWITEFSPLPTNDASVMADFLAVAIPWLDSASYVDRYSPFMADYFVTNGALNAAGTAFVKDS